MIREPLSHSDEPIPPYVDPRPPHPPSAWAAVVFAIAFFLLLVYHSFMMLRNKAWFTWTLLAASSVQCMSMVAHAYDLGYPPSTTWYVLEGIVYPLAPTLLLITCVQTFGRAAWNSVITDPLRLLRFWGFLRWNTAVFITFMVLAYLLTLLGNMIAVGVAPDAVAVEGINTTHVAAAYGVVEAGLFLQTSFMLVFTVLVLRWNMISKAWDVEWDTVRRLRWTWKKLLRVTLVCIAFLMPRQVYLLLVFFHVLPTSSGIHFVFDIAPLLVCLVLLSIWHPGRCLPRNLTAARLNCRQLAAPKQAGPDPEKQ